MKRAEWISVDTQLPATNSDVLAYKEGDGCCILCFSEPTLDHMRYTRRDGQWWNSGRRVTHWMPLPDPPEVKA